MAGRKQHPEGSETRTDTTEHGAGLPDGRARRPYLAKLAHELKTPLTAIVSASEIMRDEQLGPLGNARYRAYSADIHRTAKHALDVINRMMALRRVEAAAPDAARHVTELEIDVLLSNVASSMNPIFQRASVHLSLDISPHLPRLIADEVQIRQVLFNLLTNALKFTPTNGTVLLAAVLTPTNALQISITDTGLGMSDRSIAMVLEGAGQADINVADPATADPPDDLDKGFAAGRPQTVARQGLRGEGRALESSLGLGLPLVFQLVSENGGVVTINSPPVGASAGTCVTAQFASGRLVFI
ncbi:MAG: HAMP domain-containing sensor histidine kinase [Pseudomonadota bacterium]